MSRLLACILGNDLFGASHRNRSPDRSSPTVWADERDSSAKERPQNDRGWVYGQRDVRSFLLFSGRNLTHQAALDCSVAGNIGCLGWARLRGARVPEGRSGVL